MLLEPWWQERMRQSLAEKELSDQERHEIFLFVWAYRKLSGDLPGFFENLNRVVELNADCSFTGRARARS